MQLLEYFIILSKLCVSKNLNCVNVAEGLREGNAAIRRSVL